MQIELDELMAIIVKEERRSRYLMNNARTIYNEILFTGAEMGAEAIECAICEHWNIRPGGMEGEEYEKLQELHRSICEEGADNGGRDEAARAGSNDGNGTMAGLPGGLRD